MRILGQPNQTLQLPVQTTTATPDLVADDIFKDLNAPTMAGLAPWTGSITANTGFNQSHLAERRYWRLRTYRSTAFEGGIYPTKPLYRQRP